MKRNHLYALLGSVCMLASSFHVSIYAAQEPEIMAEQATEADTEPETGESIETGETEPETVDTGSEESEIPEITETPEPEKIEETPPAISPKPEVSIPAQEPEENLTDIPADDGMDEWKLWGSEFEEMLEDGPKEEPESPENTDQTEATGNAAYTSGTIVPTYWDDSWFISSDFRFTQVDKEYALISNDTGSYVYEDADTSSVPVGIVPYGSVVCILKQMGDNWVYAESGDIRGFLPRVNLTTGEAAVQKVETEGEQALTQGDLLCEKADNEAFTYTKTTSYPVLANKIYAVSLGSTWIYEYPSESSRYVGDVNSGSLLYVLKDSHDGWYFVESGNVRGFVKSDVLLLGNSAEQIVEDMGEDNAPLAEELMEPADNRSVYYTLLSVKSAGDGIGLDICRSAKSFIGHLPYVYGGTSLSAGADCSGFVQSIFYAFGIYLPRTAEEQGANGQMVPTVSDAKPGDIVYYASGPHVGIYLGDGKVVQCSGNSANTVENPGPGPTISDVGYMPITSIRRYLILTGEENVGGYQLDLTPYTQEQLELIWAIVAQEDNGSYEGALAVISSAMNRTESQSWGYEGGNAYQQLTADGQYCYSIDRNWISRLGGNVPGYVRQAVEDCLRHGIRNHGFTCFRSSPGHQTGSNPVRIGENWYFGS